VDTQRGKESGYEPSGAVRHLGAADPELAALIERVGPLRLAPPQRPEPFRALLRAVVYQQLAGSAAGVIHARVLALLGDAGPDPAALAGVADDALRRAGLSRNKLAALRDLARAAQDGTLPHADALSAMPDEEIIRRLCTIRGIGRWTVEMLLIFDLGRPDVLPVRDLGVRKGFRNLRGLDALPTPGELGSHGERWRPYRSAAAWYLWRAAEGGGPDTWS